MVDWIISLFDDWLLKIGPYIKFQGKHWFLVIILKAYFAGVSDVTKLWEVERPFRIYIED